MQAAGRGFRSRAGAVSAGALSASGAVAAGCALSFLRLSRIAFTLSGRFSLLVHAHGDELDHRLCHAQAALELGNQVAIRIDHQQDIVAVVELADI